MSLEDAIARLRGIGYSFVKSDIPGLYETRRADDLYLGELTTNQIINLAHDVQRGHPHP